MKTKINKNAEPLLLDVSNTTLHVTPEEFDSLCVNNPSLRLELTKDKELIVLPPTGGETGKRNTDLILQVAAWNKQTKLGEAFESSTGYDFIAIGGGRMSPDVSWIERSRLEGVDIEKFIPVVPDFVIELRSRSDKLKPLLERVAHGGNHASSYNGGNPRNGLAPQDRARPLQTKMLEYQRLGVKLGLLINPQDQQVEIYSLEQDIEILDSPTSIDCNWLMPGFNLDLTEIF
jgi:Uma2 family endonuclease